MADENTKNTEVEDDMESHNPTTTEIDASGDAGVAEGGEVTPAGEGEAAAADEPAPTTEVADAPKDEEGDVANDDAPAEPEHELNEEGYPAHQVPLPVSDAPTQETTNEPLPDDHQDQIATNPEPDTDEEGNVTPAVTQVANPEPEVDDEEVFEDAPVVDQTRVTSSTLLIEVESGQYPVSLTTIFNKFNDRSFPNEPLLYDLKTLGYDKVEDTPRPEGDVVTEGKPELDGEVWKRTWDVREWNDAEKADYLSRKKAQANQKIEEVRKDDFEMGMEFSFQDASFHVQLRDGDRINLLFLNSAAQARLAANSDETEPFRSYENISYELPPQELLELTQGALTAYKTILRGSWATKDAVDAATTVAEIPEVPGTFLPSSSAMKLGGDKATE